MREIQIKQPGYDGKSSWGIDLSYVLTADIDNINGIESKASKVLSTLGKMASVLVSKNILTLEEVNDIFDLDRPLSKKDIYTK